MELNKFKMCNPLEKVTAALLLNAFQNYTALPISFHILQEPAYGPYHKSDKSIQQHIHFTRLINFSIFLSSKFWFLKVVLLLDFPTKLSMKSCLLPSVS